MNLYINGLKLLMDKIVESYSVIWGYSKFDVLGGFVLFMDISFY